MKVVLSAFCLALLASQACTRPESKPAPVAVNSAGLAARLSLLADDMPSERTESATQQGLGGAEPIPPEPVQADAKEPEKLWGRADLNPENDAVVAPPEAVPNCHGLLETAGVDFDPADLPLRQHIDEIPTCGSHDAVLVRKGAGGMSLRPPAVMTCQMALGFAAFEGLVQKFAQMEFGKNVRSLHQGGTYSCRKMARFNLVSEHSYGNAMDIYAFTLEDGRKISVKAHYGKLAEPPATAESRFLRDLASATYDEDLFSVVLTPYWDSLHHDHFHVDMARYRVDGTRAAGDPARKSGLK